MTDNDGATHGAPVGRSSFLLRMGSDILITSYSRIGILVEDTELSSTKFFGQWKGWVALGSPQTKPKSSGGRTSANRTRKKPSSFPNMTLLYAAHKGRYSMMQGEMDILNRRAAGRLLPTA